MSEPQDKPTPHVVAPKWMDEERAANYRKWMGELMANMKPEDFDNPTDNSPDSPSLPARFVDDSPPQAQTQTLPEGAERFDITLSDVRWALPFLEDQPSAAFAYGVKRFRNSHKGVAKREGMTPSEVREAQKGYTAAMNGASEATKADAAWRAERT